MRAVLLVDQKRHTAELMKTYLRIDGYSVDHTPHSEEALKLADQVQYGVILTDLLMPGITGFDLYREITLHDMNVRFVFMITRSGETLRLLGSLDRNDFIKKEPLSINEVISKVRAAFTNSR